MRSIFSKIALLAVFGFALTFTFSCSGGDDDGGGNSSGSNSGGTSSPSSGGGSCNISSYKYKKMPDGKTWMTENLNCKVAGSECNGKEESNCNTYGRLYTWEAAKKACSGGWHLPSDDEWDALDTSVGGSLTAGKHLKAKEGWNSCGPTGSGESYSCEDTYGFSALPGGDGNSDGSFYYVGKSGHWWTATESNAFNAYGRDMDYHKAYVGRGLYEKVYFFSVRCVQD